jgi:hypothetical protein
VLAAISLVLALSGCGGPPVLDPSSGEKLRQSLAEMREPLVPDERARLDEALRYLVGNAEPPAVGEASAESELVLDIYRPLEGRTVDGIVAEAYRTRLHEVQEIVRGLEAEREAATTSSPLIDAFRLGQARVFKRHVDYLEWPVIELKVENGTDRRVDLVRLRGALLLPAEPEPWLEEEFDQVILGGLAPGERTQWRIDPEQQEWERVIDPHPNVRFELEVMALEVLGGTVLAEVDWGAVEEHRLEVYSRTLRTIRTGGALALDQPPRHPVGRVEEG